MNNVWVFIEQNHGKLQPIGLELLSECRRKLDASVQISAIYLGQALQAKDIDAMTFCGADEIIHTVDERLSVYDTHYYATAITNLMKDTRPDVFLIGSTLEGRDLAPRVSARLNTGLTADATLLEFEQSDKLLLLATRPALGGNLFATIICESTIPQMATIRPSIFKIEEDKTRTSTLKAVPFACESESKVKVLNSEKLTHKKIELNQAQVIVAGGRGVSNMFPVLKDIANLIGGEVAASRAVVDANIEQKDRLVGQTGTTVHPKVYFASGISGAIQHISGMDKSELIIAVNTDPNALIFDVADVSIIADAKQVLPLVREELKAILSYK
jgi:electron transfer flavoprotein alpha subunit